VVYGGGGAIVYVQYVCNDTLEEYLRQWFFLHGLENVLDESSTS